MDIAQLRELDTERVADEVRRLEEELAELAEQVWSGKEKNHARLGLMRRQVAQAKTVWQEKRATAETGA